MVEYAYNLRAYHEILFIYKNLSDCLFNVQDTFIVQNQWSSDA